MPVNVNFQLCVPFLSYISFRWPPYTRSALLSRPDKVVASVTAESHTLPTGLEVGALQSHMDVVVFLSLFSTVKTSREAVNGCCWDHFKSCRRKSDPCLCRVSVCVLFSNTTSATEVIALRMIMQSNCTHTSVCYVKRYGRLVTCICELYSYSNQYYLSFVCLTNRSLEKCIVKCGTISWLALVFLG
jgi:hypothetical protein